MVTFFKKNLESRGQATVEYLLLIVVVIAIATGIGGPLGRHLSDFVGALLGPDGYYACLTEKGKLPGTPECSGEGINLAFNSLDQISSGEDGKESSSGNNNKTGNNKSGNSNNNNKSGNDNNNKEGDLNEEGTGSSAGNDSQDGGKSFKSGRSKEKNKNTSRHKAGASSGNSSLGSEGNLADSSSGDSSDSPSSFSAFPASDFSSKKIKRKKRKRGGSAHGRGSKEESGEGQFNGGDQGYKRIRVRAGSAQGYLGAAYGQEEEQKKQGKPVFKMAQAEGTATRASEADPKKAKMISNRKPDKKTLEDDKIKGMNFSGFLKYLVIAILLIVVIIVIFSQVMEYQSRD